MSTDQQDHAECGDYVMQGQDRESVEARMKVENSIAR